MKHSQWFLLLLILPTFLLAQEKVDLEAVHRIKTEGLSNSKVEDIAFHLTDASGPRLTNSPGHRKAAEWAVSQLKEWGLEKVEMQEWGEFGKGWEVKKSYVAMTGPYYMPFIAVPKAWTPGTGGLVSGKVMLMEVSSDEDFKKYDGQLEGKIVLFRSSAETQPTFEADAERYKEEELLEEARQQIGGRTGRYSPDRMAPYRARMEMNRKINDFIKTQKTALVIRGSRGKHGTFFTTGGTGYKTDELPPVPELEMTPEHADLMARLIARGVDVSVEAEVETRFYDENLNSFNVIAEIPGSDKTLKPQVVMLGAHLDSWHAATGATDNASGCIVMMEAVRIIKQSGLAPKRTIRMALWSAEEQGLLGSRNYVKNHLADPSDMKAKPEHGRISAYYNIDNGTGRIRGIYLQGNDMARPVFEAWFEPFQDMIDNTTISIQNTGGTDHLSFNEVGIPGFQFIQDPIEYGTRTWHTNMDTYERLLIPDLQQMAVIVASQVYHTAQRDQMLPRKTLPQPKSP